MAADIWGSNTARYDAPAAARGNIVLRNIVRDRAEIALAARPTRWGKAAWEERDRAIGGGDE